MNLAHLDIFYVYVYFLCLQGRSQVWASLFKVHVFTYTCDYNKLISVYLKFEFLIKIFLILQLLRVN